MTEPIGGAIAGAGAYGDDSIDARHAAIAAAAQTLGMSKHEIRVALRGGQSLDDLAQQKGVSESDLTDAVTTAIQPYTGAADPSQIAQQIVSHQGALRHGNHPDRSHVGHGGGGGGGGTPAVTPPLPDGSGGLLDITA